MYIYTYFFLPVSLYLPFAMSYLGKLIICQAVCTESQFSGIKTSHLLPWHHTNFSLPRPSLEQSWHRRDDCLAGNNLISST